MFLPTVVKKYIFLLLRGDSIRSILKPLIESPETCEEAASDLW